MLRLSWGDLVFVELAEVDAEVTEGDSVCVIESVKAALGYLYAICRCDC